MTKVYLKSINLPSSHISSKTRHLHPESWYQERWCSDGEIEYRLPDRTRVDCLTTTHAVELDFANKWYEGITQAMWYGMQTKRRGAVVLIIEKPKDMIYVERARSLVEQNDLAIDVWTYSAPE